MNTDIVSLPIFEEVDLSTTTTFGNEQLTVGPIYLCLIGNHFYIGSFTSQWYGLYFHGWNHGLQYDPPGQNSSRWERVWKFVNAEDVRNQQTIFEALTKDFSNGSL